MYISKRISQHIWKYLHDKFVQYDGQCVNIDFTTSMWKFMHKMLWLSILPPKYFTVQFCHSRWLCKEPVTVLTSSTHGSRASLRNKKSTLEACCRLLAFDHQAPTLFLEVAACRQHISRFSISSRRPSESAGSASWTCGPGRWWLSSRSRRWCGSCSGRGRGTR